jgi:cellulose synthase/poly-beta-1,6-N-acetylglucosamine synthase-like glycosyltransferase
MTIIFLIFLIITFVHIILGLALFRQYPTNNDYLHSFSIVVVAHNEEQMLIPLLESLLAIDYPVEKLEIILVDDLSTDSTFSLIADYASKYPFIKAIITDQKYSDYKGKKAGLQTALDLAQNEIVVFTDADALVPKQWLKSHNSLFTSQTGMVIGYIRGENIKGLKRYKRIFSSGLFASLCSLGSAFSCSGGNLAIRRLALKQVDGYASIKDFPSGDDKQMLNLIKASKYKIAYNSQIKVIERQRNLTSEQAYQQAIRHYGKVAISSKTYQIGFIITSLFYLSIPVIVFFQPSILFLFWLGNIFFYFCASLLHKEKIYLEDIFLSIIYPYYMLYFSCLGTFTEAKWKK